MPSCGSKLQLYISPVIEGKHQKCTIHKSHYTKEIEINNWLPKGHFLFSFPWFYGHSNISCNFPKVQNFLIESSTNFILFSPYTLKVFRIAVFCYSLILNEASRNFKLPSFKEISLKNCKLCKVRHHQTREIAGKEKIFP